MHVHITTAVVNALDGNMSDLRCVIGEHIGRTGDLIYVNNNSWFSWKPMKPNWTVLGPVYLREWGATGTIAFLIFYVSNIFNRFYNNKLLRESRKSPPRWLTLQKACGPEINNVVEKTRQRSCIKHRIDYYEKNVTELQSNIVEKLC